MSTLATAPPCSPIEPVTEVLHGVTVTDPYRWLENQDSPCTRAWITAQQQYARTSLDSIPGRDRIRPRVAKLVDVETCDAFLKARNGFVFRKRLPRREQGAVYFRADANGEDRLLIDPAERGTGPYTCVKPLQVSPDGRLLLYEVKEGGERTSSFELWDLDDNKPLPDIIPRGYLRGFSFAPDCRSFYYAHEPAEKSAAHPGIHQHIFGTAVDDDSRIFPEQDDWQARFHLISGNGRLGFLVHRVLDRPETDFYTCGTDGRRPIKIIERATYRFGPSLVADGRILAITDRDAPNSRIVNVVGEAGSEPEFVDVVGEGDSPIQNFVITDHRIFVCYFRDLETEILIFDLLGRPLGQLPIDKGKTRRIAKISGEGDELLLEEESFAVPIHTYRYLPGSKQTELLAARKVPFDGSNIVHEQVWFDAKDGTRIPMHIVGRRNVLKQRECPAIMTAYGGYGVPITPQFSVFVAFLLEHGCLFALPHIRGGAEYGLAWHDAAKRRNRQTAFDDFIAAAEWLVRTGCTVPHRFGIFGGSNSGLLVAAAMTQRPDLFQAVVCMVPLTDMLRYHLFDNAGVWKDEFGSSEELNDFFALLHYSPYHCVRDGVSYPAVLMVSGDLDQNCNPLHARKMTARLQAASASGLPIILDYNHHRGHSPVLPLTERINALTDRMAFLCDQLQLQI
jgi:prolyl oligopeptidase